MIIPERGHTVRTQSNREYTLGDQIAMGGEGAVYSVNGVPYKVIKIYNKNKFAADKPPHTIQEKIEAIESFYDTFNTAFPEVCWPEKALYNNQGQFCGYLMKRAEGVTLERWSANRVNNKDYSDQQIYQIIYKIAVIIHKLHYLFCKPKQILNILIGDIQPKNIMIDSKLNVTFIDADSFSIGKICNYVQYMEYMSPERLNSPKIPRIIDEENYVMAYLFFQTLMFGAVHPYNSRLGGGETHEDFIRRGHFPYYADRGKYVSSPAYWKRWQSFPHSVQDLFTRAFYSSHPKQNPTGQIRRPTAKEWAKAFRDHLQSLGIAPEMGDTIITSNNKTTPVSQTQTTFVSQTQTTFGSQTQTPPRSQTQTPPRSQTQTPPESQTQTPFVSQIQTPGNKYKSKPSGSSNSSGGTIFAFLFFIMIAMAILLCVVAYKNDLFKSFFSLENITGTSQDAAIIEQPAQWINPGGVAER